MCVCFSEPYELYNSRSTLIRSSKLPNYLDYLVILRTI